LSAADALTAVLKRDRLVVAAALGLVIVAAWACLLSLSANMTGGTSGASDMSGMMAPGFMPWTPLHATFVFAMWSVMMVGMMTPSAAPMVLIYAQVARQARTLGGVFVPAGWFAGGYLLAWTLFAALATAAQYGLERAALLSPALAATSRYFGGGILLLAGLYQLSPVKNACLVECRAPLQFIQRRGGFKPGIRGSLRLGFLHGLYCVGCCWLLMMLLFVGGVMNVLWIAAIAIAVLAEKLLPGGPWLARSAGLVALLFGAWMLLI
jgi:predicted metal-binding membrane protein